MFVSCLPSVFAAGASFLCHRSCPFQVPFPEFELALPPKFITSSLVSFTSILLTGAPCAQHVVVTNANCGYVDMALNLWRAMQRLGLANLLVSGRRTGPRGGAVQADMPPDNRVMYPPPSLPQS